MSNLPKYAAYGIGALALLIGSFVTFSVLTGTPMNEMKAVGGLFPESVSSEEVDAEDSDAIPSPEVERNSDIRGPRQVFDDAATPLNIFAIQDPFSAEELRALEVQLQNKVNEVGRRARDQEAQERELDRERQYLEDRLAEYEDLRNTLLSTRAETEAGEQELERSNAAFDEKQQAVDKQLAELFKETKAREAAEMLTKTYSPDEAAQILINLDDDRRREIMGSIYTLMPQEGVLFYKALERALKAQ